MWRIRLTASLAFTLVSIIATAYADAPIDEPHGQPTLREIKPSGDARELLSQQLTDEAASIDHALATVTDKLGDIDSARAHRLAAAYRLLNAPATEDRMATARRRSAARLLIERDLGERRMLADEVAHLRDAALRTTVDAARLADLTMPPELTRPARGLIARRFGTLQHDRSKATLSRRGIDLEVEAHAPVVALADGTVRYAGPIRGLDSGIIVDHGSYLTIVAKLGELSVPVGAPVSRGDRLGRAARHRVYLEVRVKLGPGGLPIDPEPLISPPPKQKRR